MNNFFQRVITACILGLILYSIFFYMPSYIFSMVIITILTTILWYEWKNIFPIQTALFWLIMPLYPIAPFIMLIYLNESSVYRSLLMYLFITVFSFDTGAYLCGKLYGKHKIIPSISPGKSWQGLIGGYLIATIMLMHLTPMMQLYTTCILSAYICLAAFCGDLFESYLKRLANIKDSGNLLPGHGGLLDRFDSIMAVTILFFFYKDTLILLFS